MSARFIFGRAGSGKTAHCIAAMAAALREETAQTAPAVLLVPEQASHQTERALLATGLPGTMRGAVFSFRRLAEFILHSRPAPQVPTLTPIARLMVIQRLLRTLRERLRFFGAVRAQPGLARQVTAQIEEFIQAGLSPADLTAPSGTPQVDAKLADLRLIYAAYLELLAQGYVDPALHLDTARALLPQCGLLDGARVWVDGFAGFTRQEVRLLVAVVQRAAHAEIALLADPDATPQAVALFAPVQETVNELSAALTAGGVSLEPPLQLAAPRQRRFRTAPDLADLEARVFDPTVPRPRERPASAALAIVRHADPRAEVDGAVQTIVAWLTRRNDPLRYRDIAIVTRHIEPYAAVLTAALEAHGIPSFIDRRVPLTEHSLGVFIHDLLRVGADGGGTATLRSLIKSSVFGLPKGRYRLDRYLRFHDLGRLNMWGQAWALHPTERVPRRRRSSESQAALDRELAAINTLRSAVLERLAPWLEHDPAATGTGAAWATALFDALVKARVPQRIEHWAQTAQNQRDTATALRHRSAWQCVIQVLDDFVSVHGDTALRFEDAAGVLTAGFENADMALAPPALDQVVIGGIERSRHAPVRAAIVLGLNDGRFPSHDRGVSLLNDSDRHALIAGGIPVPPPRRAEHGDERLLAYIALTRASDHLLLSCARFDDDGRDAPLSLYLDEVQRVTGITAAPPADDFATLTTPGAIAGALARRFASGDGSDLALWHGLYDRARQRLDLSPHLHRGLRGLIDDNSTADIVLSTTDHPASISELQTFARCPFRHFTQYHLRLKTPQSDGLSRLDLGNLAHEALERLMNGLTGSLTELDDPALDHAVARTVTTLCDEGPIPLSRTHPYLPVALTAELQVAVRVYRGFQAAGSTAVMCSEQQFGATDGVWPAVTLPVSATQSLILRGKIDRVDRATDGAQTLYFVYDYKHSRAKRLKLSMLYHGLELQLGVYLMAVASGRPDGRPGGAFYLPLIPAIEKVDHPSKTGALSKGYRPRGIVDGTALHVLQGSGNEVVVGSFNRSKNTARWDVFTATEFMGLLQQSARTAVELGRRLVAGETAVHPYRLGSETPCAHCDYRGCCRADDSTLHWRALEGLSDAEVRKRVGRHA